MQCSSVQKHTQAFVGSVTNQVTLTKKHGLNPLQTKQTTQSTATTSVITQLDGQMVTSGQFRKLTLVLQADGSGVTTKKLRLQ